MTAARLEVQVGPGDQDRAADESSSPENPCREGASYSLGASFRLHVETEWYRARLVPLAAVALE